MQILAASEDKAPQPAKFQKLNFADAKTTMALYFFLNAILFVLLSVNIFLHLSNRKKGSSNFQHSKPEEKEELNPTESTSHDLSAKNQQKCFRVTNIPMGWEKKHILSWLGQLEDTWKCDSESVSLFRACMGDGKVGLLKLDNYPLSFGRIQPGTSRFFQARIENEEVLLSVDVDFYGLTPLNDPDEDIVAELVNNSTIWLKVVKLILQRCCGNRSICPCIRLVEA